MIKEIVYLSEPVWDEFSQVKDNTYQVGWYFWDETWTQLNGPYPNEELTTIALDQYVEHLLYG